MVQSEHNDIKFSKGQTLTEVIAAIGILVIGVTSVISLSIGSLVLTNQSEKRIVAVNLAREGIELARNIRDSNFLDDTKLWDTSLDVGTKKIDYINLLSSSSDFDSCMVDNGCRLNTSGGFFVHGVGSVTPYYRVIKVSQEGDGKRVLSEVRWKERNRTLKVKAEEVLYGWK